VAVAERVPLAYAVERVAAVP
jgi:hypothetical protein